MDDLNLNLLDKINSPTHFCTFSGTYSHIDLTLCSPALQQFFEWKAHTDLCSSDHFPIIIESQQKRTINKRSNWQIDKANWHVFEKFIDFSQADNITDLNEQNNYITSSIINAANLSIPKTKNSLNRTPVPWWSEEIYIAIKERKKQLRIFNRIPTQENLQLFRNKKAYCRRLIIAAKKNSWQEFVSNINVNTPTSTVWKKIKSLKGIDTPNTIITLFSGNKLTNNKIEIVKEIGLHFESSFHCIQPRFLNPHPIHTSRY